MIQIQHFHDFTFEDHQVSYPPIDASNEISRMKISRMASDHENIKNYIPSKFVLIW